MLSWNVICGIRCDNSQLWHSRIWFSTFFSVLNSKTTMTMTMIKRLKCSCALCLIRFYAILGNWATWCNPWHSHILSVLFIFSSPLFVFRIQSYTCLMTCLNTPSYKSTKHRFSFHGSHQSPHLTSAPLVSTDFPHIAVYMFLWTSALQILFFSLLPFSIQVFHVSDARVLHACFWLLKECCTPVKCYI